MGRHFSRSYWAYGLFFLLLLLASYLLPYLTYESVKREAIESFNDKQFSLARQAARGIESFFHDRVAMLRQLARSGHIVDLDETGKQVMRDFQAAYADEISIVTRIDSRGRIFHPEPFDPKVVGQPTIEMEIFTEAARSRQISVSDVFLNRRGRKSIIVHAPLFDHDVFTGTVAFLFPFDYIAKRYVEGLRVGRDGYAWMISRSGVELSCPISGHVGHSVFDNRRDSPEILAMARRMIRGEQGVITYRDARNGAGTPLTTHAVYMPVRLGNNLWSIAIAAPEDEVLAPLRGFRNRIVLIGVLLMASMGLLLTMLFRSRLLVNEIERRRKIEAELRRKTEELDGYFTNSLDLLCIADIDGHFRRLNPEWEKTFGYPLDELLGRRFLDFVHPDDMESALAAVARLAGAQSVLNFTNRYRHQDGSYRWIEWRSYPVDKLIYAVARDITDRRQAETEKDRLQEQLAQAQKMESVGRLAGGVAHDSNNIMAVILGHAEMTLSRMGPDHELRAGLEEIRRAAIRSADLTRQLLAFARKQTVSPKVLDLNETLAGMLSMLRRLIGEDIELTWIPGASLWPVRIDPSQIDQILANLCVNARDAIPGSGRVTIETGNRHIDDAYCAGHPGFIPGDFSMVSVSDNGCGMDKPTLGQLFEPFFTTKPAGKGTGLGLSTVYGIVKQNNGFINVYSEPGIGTTFRIYLPRHLGDGEPARLPPPPASVRGSETVLLVEDEPAILNVCRCMLEAQGYSVLTAASASGAMALAETHGGTIHLLVTDVVMPEMNGPGLVTALQARHPRIKSLFMSGYTANVIAHHGVLEEGVNFIQKPFTTHEFVTKVRETLDTE